MSNVHASLLPFLSSKYDHAVRPEDVVAYIACIAAHPAYTARFQSDLATPGLRIPLTGNADLFKKVVAAGQRVVWLHCYGERLADLQSGRPLGQPFVADATRRPTVPKGGAIPMGMPLPDDLRYDDSAQRLHIGSGYVDHVSPAVMKYQVDGKQVVNQWFSYRKFDRSKPPMGDRRPPSPLQAIQPDYWLPEYTDDLLNLLNVLTLLTDLENDQAGLLAAVCEGPLISEDDLRSTGTIGVMEPSVSIDTDEENPQAGLFT